MKNSLFLGTVLTALLVTGAASAAKKTFTGNLDGASEAPTPVTTAATGTATLTFDDQTKKLCGKITHTGLSGAVQAAHLHEGAPGAAGDQPTALPKAKLQVLSGAFAGRELELNKALTTLGRPGVQVAAITRRADGFFIVHVDSGKSGDYPLVNGTPIGEQARKLQDNDVILLAGVKMGFFEG